MMASGRRVSLTIPVLASIYEGLNIAATSSRPARTSHSFPVHFVYAWLASYFKTHYPVWQGLCGPKMIRFSGEGGAKYYDPQEARKRIHKVEFVSWACNMIVKNRPFKFVDNNDAEELEYNYFVAIRSSYLTLCQVTNSLLSPTVLTDLGVNLVHGIFLDDSIACLISPKPTKITLKRKNHEDEQVDGENNPLYVPVPSIMVKSNSQAVAVEASKGKGPLYNLVDSDSSNKDRHWKRQKKELMPLKALEDEIQSVDASEESETSDSWTLLLLHLGWDLKENNFHSLLQRQYLKSMKNFHKFDIAPVEESLNTFFVKVCAYDEARSLSSQKLSRSLHEQHLKEAKARLQDVQAKASEGASKEQKQLNHDAQAKVHEVEEDIATLDSTAPFDDAIVEDSKANLEIFKEDLKSLKPFA
ncbi:UNVERIFIED_CONTAM: hypothetical protein Slati_3890500 [Sesamum latifolium]|uniref:Aminotransferase-like plant mobile domain-containing protein n=1 Tax=Sesamum latifolium TaxID=2727402 RepID=A0AAW2TQB7_9LAMI